MVGVQVAVSLKKPAPVGIGTLVMTFTVQILNVESRHTLSAKSITLYA